MKRGAARDRLVVTSAGMGAADDEQSSHSAFQKLGVIEESRGEV